MANHRSEWDLRETRTERALRHIETRWGRWTPAQWVVFASLLVCSFGVGMAAAGDVLGGTLAVFVGWLLSVVALGVPR